MLALITTQLTPPERWYERLLRRRRRMAEITVSETPRYLSAALEWPLSADSQERRTRARPVYAELTRRGASQVVLPPEYPWPDDVTGTLTVCAPVPLYRRLAWRVAVREAREKGIPAARLTVALLARHPSGLLTETVRALKHEAATLAVWAGRETEEFCYGLRKYDGLALLAQENPVADIYVLLEPPAAALLLPDCALALDFTGADADIRGGVTADALELSPPAAWDETWPWGCDTQAMLQGLYTDGQVKLPDIRIGGLLRHGKPVEWQRV